MVSATEGAQATQGIGAALDFGLDVLSRDAEVTFQKYVKQILPIDGYVFWLATSVAYTKRGSLHYSINRQQSEDETLGVNQVIFTSQEKILDFNFVNPNELYLATLPDGVQYAFSQQGKYYQPANLYHYSGVAVQPALKSQIINTALGFAQLLTADPVVTNSLPIWLALNSYTPPYPGFTCRGLVTFYPSFTIPNNISPPYGSVHIDPTGTESLQSAPFYDINNSPWELSQDVVRLTIYGLKSAAIQTVRDTILQYSFDTDAIGIMDIPTIRDEKRTQVEMSTLAMKKTIALRVSYNQTTVRAVARQLIEKVVTRYLPQPLTATGFVPIAP